jgi:formate C-acetyltransferase
MKSSAARSKEADAGHCWDGFRPGDWTTSINVRDFIVRNVKPYPGNEDFLTGPTQRTKAVWAKLQPYFADERKKGVLAVDVQTPSTLLAHKPGYIDRENEVIVGLQTDQPFKRAIFPYGGLRMVEAGIEAAGFEPDPLVHEAFTKYRKSHNDGVFDAYTPEIMNCRRSGIITGLPDAYGRGRIIGDYRRVALYGVDRLLEAKREERAQIDDMWPTDEIIRVREELSEQMRALKDLAAMAKLYGLDISKPASNAQEAFQWTYFAYLGAIKEANGAAMSIGRISTFLDIYIERDLKAGVLDEARAQELWDQLVQKLRIVRFLRTPDYDAVQRRPLLGDRVRRRHGSGWPRAGDKEQLSDAPHAFQPRPRPRAEHHGALVGPHADSLQALLRQGQQGYILTAIRERRPDAAVLG